MGGRAPPQKEGGRSLEGSPGSQILTVAPFGSPVVTLLRPVCWLPLPQSLGHRCLGSTLSWSHVSDRP